MIMRLEAAIDIPLLWSESPGASLRRSEMFIDQSSLHRASLQRSETFITTP
jgi:hypothetical protein